MVAFELAESGECWSEASSMDGRKAGEHYERLVCQYLGLTGGEISSNNIPEDVQEKLRELRKAAEEASADAVPPWGRIRGKFQGTAERQAATADIVGRLQGKVNVRAALGPAALCIHGLALRIFFGHAIRDSTCARSAQDLTPCPATLLGRFQHGTQATSSAFVLDLDFERRNKVMLALLLVKCAQLETFLTLRSMNGHGLPDHCILILNRKDTRILADFNTFLENYLPTLSQFRRKDKLTIMIWPHGVPVQKYQEAQTKAQQAQTKAQQAQMWNFLLLCLLALVSGYVVFSGRAAPKMEL